MSHTLCCAYSFLYEEVFVLSYFIHMFLLNKQSVIFSFMIYLISIVYRNFFYYYCDNIIIINFKEEKMSDTTTTTYSINDNNGVIGVKE